MWDRKRIKENKQVLLCRPDAHITGKTNYGMVVTCVQKSEDLILSSVQSPDISNSFLMKMDRDDLSQENVNSSC